MFNESKEKATDQATSVGAVHFEMFFNCCVAHPSVLMRREIFARLETKYDIKHKHIEDLGLWLNCIVPQNEKVCFEIIIFFF